jgi:hypothetical protein
MAIRNSILRFLQGKAKAIQQPLLAAHNDLKYDSLDRLDRSIRQLGDQAERLKELTVAVLFNRWLTHPDVLASRMDVGYWLNWLGLTGDGVEVGVLKGQFSFHLLNTWEGSRLTSVDPWREFPSSEYIDTANLSLERHQQNYQECLGRLAPFGERSRVRRTTSCEAAREFAEGSLEFVYLDAQHHYEAVRDDIQAWYPKLKAGGVLGGHDYLDGTISSSVFGVKRAVDEFAASISGSIIVTREPVFKSWFLKVP